MIAHVNFVILALCFAAVLAAPADEACDKSKCNKGPLKYYKELGCEPVYKDSGDCCPYKYNCDHLATRSNDKCYANGKEYNIGETLKDEDRNSPCDIGCFCRESNGVAGFTCAVVDCFTRFQPGCYNPRNATQCCAGVAVCPEKAEDWPKCEVDGKTYKAGENFTPANEPNKVCYCGPNYTGENIEPFCRTRSKTECGVELRHGYEIQNNCAPVYYSSQSPQTDCIVAYRCQNDKDAVVEAPASDAKSTEEKTEKCKFGNLEMNMGDELNQATDYSSVCVKCVCDMPPVPTCQRLPDEECDVTKHPDFTT